MSAYFVSKPKSEIRVELLNNRDGLLEFKVRCPAGLDKYFKKDTFYVKYDKDIGGVSESVLYIPVIANLASISWATGADIHVKELDRTFIDSLRTIKEVVKGLFPRFSCAGEINVENIVSNRFGHTGSAQLFTGGVDSFTTYARHRDEKPDLISFGIYTLFNKSLQRRIFQELSMVTEKEGIALHRVESNMNYTFFDHTALISDFDASLRGDSWWASVQHGLGLLGICAPLTAIHNIGRVYIASSATKDPTFATDRAWGSHPGIDGNVAWADVKAVHDGTEWSRQDKIRFAIKPYIEKTGNYPHLIVCNERERGKGLNCGRCEKCCRTIVGLALDGIDPNRCGFNVDSRTFDRIRRKLRLRPLRFTHIKYGLWRDIQRAIPETISTDLYGSRAFFEWLRTYEFLEDDAKYRPRLERVLEKCLQLGLIK
jgi:hypothetical protein